MAARILSLLSTSSGSTANVLGGPAQHLNNVPLFDYPHKNRFLSLATWP